MSTFDPTLLKIKWRGQWEAETKYLKNDIASWKGRSWRCIKDTPDEFVLPMSTTVSTQGYQFTQPRLRRKTYRPDLTEYWTPFLNLTGRKIAHWNYHDRYFPGDYVKCGDKIYVCKQTTRNKNTWVEETEYFEQIFESGGSADKRNKAVSWANRAPLGWKYNMGDNHVVFETNYAHATGITSDGNVIHIGDYTITGKGATGDQGTNSGNSKHQYSGFTFTDWLGSTDNASWNPNATGPLTTPDGKTPRCIQIAGGWNTSLYLFNNGEVYSAGYNGHGQLGVTTTGNRYYSNRVSDTRLTDTQGNTIPRTFNQTKIVKVGLTNDAQQGGSASCFALGADGSVWVWGNNDNGQLGLGQPTPSNSNNLNNFHSNSANNYSPWRLPQYFFDDRRIVDMWAGGSNNGSFYALDDMGKMWAWGNNNYGELGVGTENGEVYITTPQPVTIDFNDHGGMKKFMLLNMENSGGTAYWLDGNGFIWYCGYMYNGGNPGTQLGGTNSMYWGTPRRMESELNGNINNFWVGGDSEAPWMVIEQTDQIVPMATGTMYNYGSGFDTHNTYYQGSGKNYTEFSRVEGPKAVKWVTQTGGSGYTNSSSTPEKWSTIFLDSENMVWTGGYNGYGALSQGHSGNNSTNWSDGGPQSPSQDMDDNEMYYSRKRKVITPSGVQIHDVHGSGHSEYGFVCYIGDTGKVYFAGASGVSGNGYETGQYNMFSAEYYRVTGVNPGSYHRYAMHSGPTD